MVQYRATGLAAPFGQVGRTQQRGGLGRQATGIGQGRQQSTGLGESGGERGENSEQKGQSGDRREKKSVFLLLSGYSHQPQTMVCAVVTAQLAPGVTHVVESGLHLVRFPRDSQTILHQPFGQLHEGEPQLVPVPGVFGAEREFRRCERVHDVVRCEVQAAVVDHF